MTTKPRHATNPHDTWSVYQTLFDDHLESVNAAPRTKYTYGIAVEQLGAFLRMQGMTSDPTRVTREHLTEWMRHLQRPKSDGGQGVVAQTAKQRFRSVYRLFAWLVETDEVQENPMAKMRPPQVPEKMVPVIAEDDLKKLFKAVSGTDYESRRDKAIISLFIDCGLRIGEMANIDFTDIDVDEREVTVLGKGRRVRRVRFIRESRSDIMRYLLKRTHHPHAEADALWLGKRGRLTVSGIYRMVVRRCEQARIPKTHPHAFRHTFAHQYLRSGGSEGNLMSVTGWRSRSMVDRYGAGAASARAADAHDNFSPRRGL